MIEDLLRHPEVVKALMNMSAGVSLGLFTIYLLVKLLEKIVMKGDYRKTASQDLKEIKDFVEKIATKKDDG